MARILFLAHRIPYPPTKGDKIRSWHFLNHLLSNHDVDLAFFVDDEKDLAHIPFLREKCANLSYAYASPRKQKFAALKGFFNGRSLTENAYPSTELRGSIAEILARDETDLIFAFSAATMAWLPTNTILPPMICDMVDVDSAKWRAYSEQSRFPLNWVYGREARKLAEFEHKVTSQCEKCLLVSDDEAAVLKEQLHNVSQKADHVLGLTNGVDCSLFSPVHYPTRKPGQGIKLIFTGAMDYQPNVEAVLWFADRVLPKLIERNPTISFTVAGGPVAAAVDKLKINSAIHIKGRVADMAQEIAACDIVVAPLQTARGIQNKVLEGMAMAKPVIASSQANEGINAPHGSAIYLADTPENYVDAILRLSADPETMASLGTAARKFVKQSFSWDSSFKALDQIVDDTLNATPQQDKSA